MCNSSRQAGFTLVELIFFIVVVGLGIAGILSVMNVSVAGSADPMVRKQAMALADSVMEEIMLQPFADPDGVGGEATRATFDDVGDYNGIDEVVSAAGPIFQGLPANLNGYRIQVAVVPAVFGGLAALRVTVVVTQGRDAITMTAFRAN